MGNSKSNYARHEDDADEQQQQTIVRKGFRLILGQLDITKEKKFPSNTKQLRKLSSSSSDSTIASSSSEHQQTFSLLIPLDIPISSSNSDEFDTETLIQHLLQQQSTGKELSHLFKIPSSNNRKSQLKTLSTLQIAAIYYEQSSMTADLNIECISLLNEFEQKLEEFYEKNILSIYTSKSNAYIIYTNNVSMHNKYKLIHSTIMSKNVLENFEWLQPFIDYSKQGYRLCGLIPFINIPFENCFTIYWLFEQIENDEILSYDYCLLEYQFKSFSLNNWKSLINLMSKQEWKLVATFDFSQKKKHNEQLYFLIFFQRLKN